MSKKLINIGIKAKKASKIKVDKKNKNKVLKKYLQLIDKNLKEYARGLSSFSSEETIKIQGHHSNKINELLGYISKSEVVHKDDMVEI